MCVPSDSDIYTFNNFLFKFFPHKYTTKFSGSNWEDSESTNHNYLTVKDILLVVMEDGPFSVPKEIHQVSSYLDRNQMTIKNLQESLIYVGLKLRRGTRHRPAGRRLQHQFPP